MKIGILTFHRGNNYGGILQCYALQQVLKSLGHSVEIVNYNPHFSANLLKRVYVKYATANSLGGLFASLRDFIGGRKALHYNRLFTT